MRDHQGLTASPPVRGILIVERASFSRLSLVERLRPFDRTGEAPMTWKKSLVGL